MWGAGVLTTRLNTCPMWAWTSFILCTWGYMYFITQKFCYPEYTLEKLYARCMYKYWMYNVVLFVIAQNQKWFWLLSTGGQVNYGIRYVRQPFVVVPDWYSVTLHLWPGRSSRVLLCDPGQLWKPSLGRIFQIHQIQFLLLTQCLLFVHGAQVQFKLCKSQ